MIGLITGHFNFLNIAQYQRLIVFQCRFSDKPCRNNDKTTVNNLSKKTKTFFLLSVFRHILSFFLNMIAPVMHYL
jgi:hypothetical protein